MTTLTFILAARGKPVQLCETVEQNLSGMRERSTRFIVALDSDDDFTIDYSRKRLGDSVDFSIEAREDGFGDKWNRALTRAPADIYGCGFDDEMILSEAWDSKFLESYEKFLPEDGIGAIYNHLINAAFPSCPAYTQNLVHFTNYIYPPYFPFWFIDHWMDEILRLIQRISFADIKTKQNNGRGKTRAMRDLEFWGKFFDDSRVLRILIAKDIIESEAFCEAKRRKAMLLNNIEMMLPKLIILNQCVRQNWKEIERQSSEAAPDDARSARARQRAIELLNPLKEAA